MNTAPLVHDISGSYDAFARLRISTMYTVFDSKTLYDKLPYYWTEGQISGSGTSSTFNTNQASVTLNVSNLTAGNFIRQTKVRFPYQPGKSHLVMMTGILGNPTTGITSRIGYFDNNNGLFFELNQNGYCIVKRTFTSGVAEEERIYQNNWNKFKLETEEFVSLDLSKTNIFYFNFEWLGVGDLICGVVINNNFIPLHQFVQANKELLVSMSTPNLPCRYQIINDGTGPASSLLSICSTVISEGGREVNGIVRTISRGVNPVTIPKFDPLLSNIFYPLLAVRIKNTHNTSQLYLQTFDILVTNSTSIFRWLIILNPTFSGTSITYTSYSPYSCIEYNNTITNTTTVSGGEILYSGYGIGTGSKNITSSSLSFRNSLGFDINNNSDVLVFAAQLLNNQSDTIYGDFTVLEAV